MSEPTNSDEMIKKISVKEHMGGGGGGGVNTKRRDG